MSDTEHTISGSNEEEDDRRQKIVCYIRTVLKELIEENLISPCQDEVKLVVLFVQILTQFRMGVRGEKEARIPEIWILKFEVDWITVSALYFWFWRRHLYKISQNYRKRLPSDDYNGNVLTSTQLIFMIFVQNLRVNDVIFGIKLWLRYQIE